jgi:uncharacterized protein (TIGR00730 family)
MKIIDSTMYQSSTKLSKKQIKQLQDKIVQSQSYQLAYADSKLLSNEDLRPVRLQLELLKPERVLREKNINSTIVIFGSARILNPDQAQKQLLDAQRQIQENPDDAQIQLTLKKAQRQVKQAMYYQQAHKLAKIVSLQFQQQNRKDFVVVTGGGPGIMEAANRGAFDVEQHSVGFNITLEHEQAPNPYISPGLCFQFQYFALRKMHFLLRAKALIAFPGGFGTLDEVFEVLTLVQTKKMKRLPIILLGKEYWQRVIDFDYLCQEGFIHTDDLALFHLVDTAEQAVKIMVNFYHGQVPK